MIKLKKKNREKQHPKAARGAHTPEDAETGKRHRLQVDSASVSQDMGIKKKAKTSSSSFPSACSKEASKTASTAGTATENISLNGGVVDCERLRRAIGALCRHVQKKQKEEEIQDLLANSGGPMVSLMFSLQNVPEGQRIYPHLIELPYSPHDASGEVCLIVKDPQRKWKDIVAAAQPSLSFIKKVISYKKLSKKFPQFADKRSLCSAYDLFLVDSKVKEKVYNILGKTFFSANKLPLPIRVGPSTIEREAKKAHRSTPLILRRGSSLALRIGRVMGGAERLYANAIAAIKGASEFFQDNHKWRNVITNIHVQATDTPALPVYIHPKYAQAAEYYANNKPPPAEANESNINENNNKQVQEDNNAKLIHKFTDTRQIKRGKTVEKEDKKKDKSKTSKQTNEALKDKKIKLKTNK